MSTTNNKIKLVLSLSLLKGIGPGIIKKNLAKLEKINSNEELDLEFNLIQLTKAFEKTVFSSLQIKEAIEAAKKILVTCQENNIDVINIIDPNYPAQLKKLTTPPPVLYIKGKIALLNRDIVSIIGTRYPNDKGVDNAQSISEYFISHGWVICNGIAQGIDSSAIKNSKNNEYFSDVIGVVGSSLDQASLSSLSKQSAIHAKNLIEQGGLIISEIPPVKKQDTFSTIKSCRIQAGLSLGLVLVQSPLKGGSRFTMKAAVEAEKIIGVFKYDETVETDINREPSADSANRHITKNRIQGLYEFVEINNGKKKNIQIVIIQNKDDYSTLEKKMKNLDKQLVLF